MINIKPQLKSKKVIIIFVVIAFLIITTIVFLLANSSVRRKNALQKLRNSIEKYNIALTDFNVLSDKYNKSIEESKAENIIDLFPKSENKSFFSGDFENETVDFIKELSKQINDKTTAIGREKEELNAQFQRLLDFNAFAEATVKYNEAVTSYNDTISNYNQLLLISSIEFLDGFLNEYSSLPQVSLKANDISSSILKGNTVEKIEADITTINKYETTVQDDYRVLTQITAPSDNWVTERIRPYSLITDIQAVSNSNDPNHMLGKEGGYIGCIYFTLSSVEKLKIKGNNALEKGTDGGGAIEIFSNSFDAKARCEYLSQYDTTIFYSGSYVVVGTMVIRVSYLLPAEKQYEITKEIIQLLIK